MWTASIFSFNVKRPFVPLDFLLWFGLGSTFETGDEYIFLRNAFEKNLNIIHCPKVILSHKSISSGQVVGKDKIIFARAAIFYKYYGTLSYLKLFHHIILLLNIKAIVIGDIFLKYKIGLKGIEKYKSMLWKIDLLMMLK